MCGERSSPAGYQRCRRRFVEHRRSHVRVLLQHVVAARRIAQLIHQTQTGHRVLRVANRLAVLRRDFQSCEFSRKRRSAHQQRYRDSGFAQIGRGNHHLLRALHQQARKANGVRLMFAMRANQFLRRNLDSQIDHVVAVIFQNDFHQIFADVVNVAFHRREHHLGALFRVGLFHELFQMVDRRFHRFGGLQHFRNDQLVVVEQAAHFAHPRHQRAVNDVQRRGTFSASLRFRSSIRPSFEPSMM